MMLSSVSELKIVLPEGASFTPDLRNPRIWAR